MLGLYILCWSTDPVLTLQRNITVFELIELSLLNWWIDVVVGLRKLWFAHGNIDVMHGWFLFCTCQKVVDVASSASIDLILLGHVACVAWKVVLVVLYESFGRHF